MCINYCETCLFSPKKPTPPPPPADWSKEDSKVVFLTDETFDNYLANNSDVLVMFYAPCKYDIFYPNLHLRGPIIYVY